MFSATCRLPSCLVLPCSRKRSSERTVGFDEDYGCQPETEANPDNEINNFVLQQQKSTFRFLKNEVVLNI